MCRGKLDLYLTIENEMRRKTDRSSGQRYPRAALGMVHSWLLHRLGEGEYGGMPERIIISACKSHPNCDNGPGI